MKKLLFVSGLILFIQFSSFGQYISFPVSLTSDIIFSPMELHNAPTGRTNSSGDPIYADIPFQHVHWNIATFGMGYRHNLIEFNTNSSLAINGTVNLGFGVNSQVYGSDSTQLLVSLQIPILLKWYTGNMATSESDKIKGFCIGLGVEINKLGFLANKENYPYNNAFIQPCASLGFIYMKDKGGKQVPREFNFKFGMGALNSTSVNGQGLPFDNKTHENVRPVSVKLSIVIMPAFLY